MNKLLVDKVKSIWQCTIVHRGRTKYCIGHNADCNSMQSGHRGVRGFL